MTGRWETGKRQQSGFHVLLPLPDFYICLYPVYMQSAKNKHASNANL